MANAAYIRGFQAVGTIGGGSGKIQRFAALAADATVIGRGDFVTATGASGQPTDFGAAGYVAKVPVAAQSATGGVFAGASLTFRDASLLRSIWVNVDPNTLYEGRIDGGANAVAAADAQLNANIIVAAANTTTGWSQMQIDGTTEATTNTLDLKLLNFLPYVGNDDTLANPHWLVRINRHRYVDQVAGV